VDAHNAYRYLFSYLVHLERLAAKSAEGVPNQHEDELRHIAIFESLAHKYGGLLPETEPCQRLTKFCTDLSGEHARIVLNIVAEHWLERIFTHLVHWVEEDDRQLVQSVLDDEARHVSEAPLPKVRGNKGALVGALEQRLHEVAADPQFIYPLCYLGGAHAVASMAADIHRSHERALARLGENAGEWFQAMNQCRAEVDSDREPLDAGSNLWRDSAFNLNLGAMVGFVDIPWRWSTDPTDVEARVVRAVGRVLSRHQSLHRTLNVARRECYLPRREVVGVRRLGYPGVVSVAIAEPSEDLRAVAKEIRWRHRRALTTPTEIQPIPPDLLRLQPRPRMSAVVTSLMGAGGITFGLAPLVECEGAVWSVGVGGEFINSWPWRKRLRIGVQADHRAVDGQELCSFLRLLKQYLED
jgi:hypothetical protein